MLRRGNATHRGAVLARLLAMPSDACPHVRREDLLFLAPFLADMDWSPEAWPLTKWRLLNFEDTGHCAPDGPPPERPRRRALRTSRPRRGLSILSR